MLNRFLVASAQRNISLLSRLWSGSNGTSKYTEQQIIDTLRSKFQDANYIEVNDVSGGCGAMYEVLVESLNFKGLSTVKQHQMVTSALKNEIKNMHGIRIRTAIPSDTKF